jgi:hypothetical protein
MIEAYVALSDALDTALDNADELARWHGRNEHARGWAEGYEAAQADDRFWELLGHDLARSPRFAELETRRWGERGRACFGEPRPGDYPGTGQ